VIALIVAVAVPFACALGACGSKSGAKGDAPSGSGSGKGGGKGNKLEFPVEVAKVEAEPVQYVVNAPGAIEAFERVQVVARVAGAVDKVAFTEGMEVKAGQVLVSIERDRYALAVGQAQVALERAEANQADAEADLKRRQEAKTGLISAEEIQTFETKVRLAKADVAAAKESVLAASLNLRDAQVKAPIDGVMQTRSVETGQYVQPGLMLGTLLRRDPLLLRFDVSTQDAPRIKPGLIASFTMRESQRTYTAKITLVAGSADPKSHLVEVTGEVDDKEHTYWLRPGAFCDVTIGVGATRLSPVVPETAIRPDQRGFLAYVVVGGVAKEHILKLGMHTANGLVEVTDGLQVGDMLVVRGAEPLSDGAGVKVTTTSTIALGSAAASMAPSLASGAPSFAPGSAPSSSGSMAKKHEGKAGAP
jgi:RND family efflux transporter MFP subunit